jgi:hypothetical protein
MPKLVQDGSEDTLTKSVELCQVLVSHSVTLTEHSAAPGSHSSRIVVQRLEGIFCVMEESKRIDTIKVETDVSIHNEEDVIGMETDGVCVPQGCEPEENLWLHKLQ